MRVVVISIGNPPYAEDAKTVLVDYFQRHGLAHSFLTEDSAANVRKAHPSWLKLLMHDLFDEDYIICWDLDLLPTADAPQILTYFNCNLINMCVDSSLLAGFPGFNMQFSFNGGLIGIPKHFGYWMKTIYDKHAPGTLPSYEQYYLNNQIVADNIAVNALPNFLNTLYPRNQRGRELWDTAKLRHYTFGVMDDREKAKLIKQHHDDYFTPRSCK